MTITEPALDADASTLEAQLTSWQGNDRHPRSDTLAVEEPLEIRLAGCSVAVTMRTPGDDFDLAAGFLFTEGIIRGMSDITSIAHCPSDDLQETPDREGQPGGMPLPPAHGSSNIVNVNPSDPALVDPDRWRRNFFATSSCGICGKASIEAVWQNTSPITSSARVPARTLYRLDAELRKAQTVFSQTGGLHAAGLFDLEGRLLALREDVGRHNAVDKVIGDALRREAIPLSDTILMVSGRASFEIVQKALMAGIATIAAVSAPSSLAVELARQANMTLVGFLRTGRFNAYAGAERLAPQD